MAHGKRRDLRLERQWRKRLARHGRGGVTAREFCRREGVAESAFHFWKREISRREAARGKNGAAGRLPGERRPARASSLVPVTIGPPFRHVAPIEVRLSNGVSVRVAAGCDEATLRMVLTALESRS